MKHLNLCPASHLFTVVMPRYTPYNTSALTLCATEFNCGSSCIIWTLNVDCWFVVDNNIRILLIALLLLSWLDWLCCCTSAISFLHSALVQYDYGNRTFEHCYSTVEPVDQNRTRPQTINKNNNDCSSYWPCQPQTARPMPQRDSSTPTPSCDLF